MFKLPKLDYGYDAFEGVISSETMKTHHTKHHQTYVDKLNLAVEQVPELADKSIENLLSNLNELPENIRVAVRNHGGGHYNHSLFWQCMSPSGGGKPNGELLGKIEEKYGSFQNFVDDFSEKAVSIFGSGWVWLTSELEVLTTPNQNSPISDGKTPILGLDVWEHAYYIDHRSNRLGYVNVWWEIVDWQKTKERFDANKNFS